MYAKRYSTGSPCVDQLLEGGLKRGHILELSAPPGALPQTCAIHVAREFVKDGQGVIFAGLSLYLQERT